MQATSGTVSMRSVIIMLRTIAIRGGGCLRVHRNHNLIARERKDAPVSVRWTRLCTFLLLTRFQHLGNRCCHKCCFTFYDVIYCSMALRLWHYAVRDSFCQITPAHDLQPHEKRWWVWMRRLCDPDYVYGGHIWSPTIVGNYLRFGAASRFSARIVAWHARSLLRGYTGVSATDQKRDRILMIMCRRLNYIGRSTTSLSGHATSDP